MKKLTIALTLLCSLSSHAIDINNSNDYLVKKGDTLWDISAHFLKSPWEWKKIWQNNPQIKNPHLIYPNDLIHLSFNREGEPYLSIERNVVKKEIELNAGIKEIKTKVSDKVPAINTKAIDFFDKNYFVSKEEIEGKILSGIESNLLSYKNTNVYIYVPNGKIGETFSTLRSIENLKKHGTIYKKTGEIKLIEKSGDVFKAKITKNLDAISNKDVVKKITPFDKEQIIFPKKSNVKKNGKIIYTIDRINASKNDIVLINYGKNHGIELGDVFKVIKSKKTFKVNDKLLSTNEIKKGLILVYKLEDDFSYAIIVKNEENINTNDVIVSPK